jgi:murein DD-endopeptidase MepM/ murein hydrolase activator NlpD
MRALLLAAMLVGVAACQRDGQTRNPDCDVTATTITDTSIGPLYLGEAVGALRVRCGTVADTTVIVPMPGWMDTVPAKRLAIAGAPVLAIHEGDKVIALRVSSPGPRTFDGIEVGTSIARFKQASGLQVSQSQHSGAVLLQDRRHCGKIFELSSWGAPLPAMEHDPPLGAPAIASWPDTIDVVAITLSACTDRSRSPGVDSAFNAREDSMSRADSAAAPRLPAPGATPSTPPMTSPPVATLPSSVLSSSAPSTVGSPASSREIAELRRILVVPVEGVTRTDLRDTYSEARGTRAHEALDIRAPRGTAVLSAADGKLMRLFNSETGGLMVYAADPTDRFILLYGHLDRYAAALRDGMPLKQGQVIGYVGTTGNAPSGTPHLHFGILRGKPSANWSRGVAVNPFPLLVP